jgi:hypothetical protein
MSFTINQISCKKILKGRDQQYGEFYSTKDAMRTFKNKKSETLTRFTFLKHCPKTNAKLVCAPLLQGKNVRESLSVLELLRQFFQ